MVFITHSNASEYIKTDRSMVRSAIDSRILIGIMYRRNCRFLQILLLTLILAAGAAFPQQLDLREGLSFGKSVELLFRRGGRNSRRFCLRSLAIVSMIGVAA